MAFLIAEQSCMQQPAGLLLVPPVSCSIPASLATLMDLSGAHVGSLHPPQAETFMTVPETLTTDVETDKGANLQTNATYELPNEDKVCVSAVSSAAVIPVMNIAHLSCLPECLPALSM